MIQKDHLVFSFQTEKWLAFILTSRTWFLTVLLIISVSGCLSPTPREEATATFKTLSIGAAGTVHPEVSHPTQRELRDAVVRIGMSYANALSEKFLLLVRQAESAALRAEAQAQLSAISMSILQIMTGPSPEDNLLDMLVLSTLLRTTFEDHWVPKVYGVKAESLLQTMRVQEKALWDLSAKFLDPTQRSQLRKLINDWRRAYPEQVDVEVVRLVDFATDDTVRNLQPAGLLPEISEVTRSIDETRVLAERLSVLALFLPDISLMHARAAVYEGLAAPESRQLLSDLSDFTVSARSMAETADGLPSQLESIQSALIKEFLDRLSREREAAITQIKTAFEQERQQTINQFLYEIEKSSTELSGVLAESRQTLVAGKEVAKSTTEALMTFDAIAVKLGWDEVDSSGEPFNILAYRDTVYGLRDAAKELDTTLGSANRLVNTLGSSGTTQNLDVLMELLDRRVRNWLLLAFALGVVSVLAVRGLTTAVVLLYRRHRVQTK